MRKEWEAVCCFAVVPADSLSQTWCRLLLVADSVCTREEGITTKQLQRRGWVVGGFVGCGWQAFK